MFAVSWVSAIELVYIKSLISFACHYPEDLPFFSASNFIKWHWQSWTSTWIGSLTLPLFPCPESITTSSWCCLIVLKKPSFEISWFLLHLGLIFVMMMKISGELGLFLVLSMILYGLANLLVTCTLCLGSRSVWNKCLKWITFRQTNSAYTCFL